MRYWPFLTGRVRSAGHQVIAAPDLLTADQAQQLLGPLPAPRGGLPSERGEVLRRVVRGFPAGPVTVFYRVVEATAPEYGIDGDGALRDQYGRPILVTEGIVVRGVHDGAFRHSLMAALDETHRLVVPAFQEFWARDEEFTQVPVAGRKFMSAVADDRTVARIVDMSDSIVDMSDAGEARAPVAVRAPRGLVRRLLVVMVVVLTGLVAGVITWRLWPDACGGVFSGFRFNDEENRECIGITDGSYLFNDPGEAADDADRATMERINAVQDRIAAENSEVATADRYVKVVLLMPLTVSQARPSAMSLQHILHSLEGAYTGLMRANHTTDFGDPSATRLQLLLANQGSQLEAGTDFIDDILEVSQPDHPVVTVVGMGVSQENTKTAAGRLAARGIPMVSAITSADDLTDLPLLWSVSPSNTEYVRSMKDFLEGRAVLNSGIIVNDGSPDLYTQSLAAAYRAVLGPEYLKYPDQSFQGSAVDSPGAPTVFDPVVRNVCNAIMRTDAPLDMVFYAGREADFDEFTQALTNRNCADRPLTVLTASVGSFASPQSYSSILESGDITLVYASSSGFLDEVDAPPGYARFVAAYHEYASGDDADLTDGYAIAHHDALVTAAQAIRLATSSPPTRIPGPAQVASDGFGRLDLAYEVPAASGTLRFPPEGGRATGQVITINTIE
jgi:hypothetical protein